MSESSPIVAVLAGPNGAGKSTASRTLIHQVMGISDYVNADDIAVGLSRFNPEGAAMAAGRVMLDRIEDLSRRRVSFGLETTLATRSYAARISGWMAQGYAFHLVFLWLRSPELAIERVKHRVAAGGHSIPEDVIRRRYNRGWSNFLEIFQPLAAAWWVYDSSSQQGPELIAAGSSERVARVDAPDVWDAFLRKPSHDQD